MAEPAASPFGGSHFLLSFLHLQRRAGTTGGRAKGGNQLSREVQLLLQMALRAHYKLLCMSPWSGRHVVSPQPGPPGAATPTRWSRTAELRERGTLGPCFHESPRCQGQQVPCFSNPQCSCPQETPAMAKYHTLLQVQTESRTPGRCWSLATPSRPGNNDLETEKGQAGGENTLRKGCKFHSRFHPTLSSAPYRGAQLSFPLVAKLGQRKSYACSISQKVLQWYHVFYIKN